MSDIDEKMATESQFEFAKKIADKLEVELPQELTKKEYSEFIQHYLNEYNKVLDLYGDESEDSLEGSLWGTF